MHYFGPPEGGGRVGRGGACFWVYFRALFGINIDGLGHGGGVARRAVGTYIYIYIYIAKAKVTHTITLHTVFESCWGNGMFLRGVGACF